MEIDILAGVILGIQSYWDIREQKIPTNVSIIGGILGFLLSVHTKRSCLDVCMALLPGVSMLIVGWISKESIGYGDGILISILGLFYTWEVLLEICFLSFLCSAGAALVLLVVLKKRGKDTIPFVPFLMLGWGISIWG